MKVTLARARGTRLISDRSCSAEGLDSHRRWDPDRVYSAEGLVSHKRWNPERACSAEGFNSHKSWDPERVYSAEGLDSHKRWDPDRVYRCTHSHLQIKGILGQVQTGGMPCRRGRPPPLPPPAGG